MTDNALVVSNGNGPALAHYQGREEVRELGDRLMKMHPAAGEVGADAMRAAAQLALLLGANPLPGVNEIHIWRDNKGRNCMSLGINFWRRKAEEWGGVLYEVRPRLMRPDEATEYGVPNGTTAAICKGVRANDMLRYRQLGFSANEVWGMCGRTGVGTTTPNDYAKQGRPPSWTALKRAETDMLRQLFPAEFSRVDREMVNGDAPAIVVSGVDMVEGEIVEEGELTGGVAVEATSGDQPPRPPITLAIANAELFGDTPSTRGNGNPPATNGNGSQTPEPATDPGPLADDEIMVMESSDFINAAAAALGTDASDIKRRMGAAGLAFPKTAAARLAAFRQLRGDRPATGKPQAEPAQDALFTVEPEHKPGAEYQD